MALLEYPTLELLLPVVHERSFLFQQSKCWCAFHNIKASPVKTWGQQVTFHFSVLSTVLTCIQYVTSFRTLKSYTQKLLLLFHFVSENNRGDEEINLPLNNNTNPFFIPFSEKLRSATANASYVHLEQI